MWRAAVSICAAAISSSALAQPGPGLGNLTYAPSEVLRPAGYIESPYGHGNVTMVQGYLMVIYSSDGGGNDQNGGIELWNVSNPRAPVRVIAYDDANTHRLREAHGFSLAWYDDRLLLAAQGVTGIQIWDVTEPLSLRLVSDLDLAGIDRGDYSGDWWLFWQAPYLYVAGVDSGLYVIDASVPEAPVVLTQVPTGALGGVSPAQVFVLGNLAVVMQTQGSALATLDVSIPEQPRLLRQLSGRSGYSSLLAGDGKILVSGNIPPRAHFLQLSPDGEVSYLDTVGFFFNSGGYGSYQDGIFHSGFSNNYVKFRINPPAQLGTGSSGRSDRDEDFATVLGNVVFAGDDHGVGSALIPHQAAPDTNPPVVEWMHPPAGATGVALTSRVGLSFSDHVDVSSLSTATLWLEDDAGVVIPVRRSAQMGLVNLAPMAELGLMRTYKIVATGVRDLAGNPSPRFEGTFTTGDGSTVQSPTAAVANVDVNIGFGSYALGIFSEGKRVYSDRDYTFTAQYPPRFERQAYLQSANADRSNFLSDFVSFELLAPAEVSILYDARASSIPNWMSGFTPTGETVVTTDTALDVYSRQYPRGRVELGGNSAAGARGAQSMYSVVIVPEPVPCEIDLTPALTGTVTLTARGPAGGSYEWRVAGRTFSTVSPSLFLPPGRHPIALRVADGPLGASCGGVKIVHRPLVPEPARAASRLVWDGGHTLNTNPDQRSASRIDPAAGRVIWETAIGGTPGTLALRGAEVWVVDRDGARLVVLAADTGRELRSIALPRASQPFGLVLAPDGSAFVTLSATGEVLRIGAGGTIEARAAVPSAHGVTWFDGKLYVTRFVSAADRGEIYVLDASTLAEREVIALELDPGPDSESSGRGVPNYVAEVQISPDGVFGFVPSKKDNVSRGLFRDGQPLTFESRVRTIVSPFLVATSSAPVHLRFDVNDRDLVQSALVSPRGDLLFVASQGVNRIDVFDLASRERVSQFDVGLAPRAMALDAAGARLAVYNDLSRSVSFFDVEGLLQATSNAARELGTVASVRSEALPPLVLEGKRIFNNAADPRMSRDSYISCASCHLDGGHDGRTWDFTQAGEGLRNTISLLGRSGLGHGRVHWTANFDEIQDFEHDIRLAFGGRGFLTDAQFAATGDPLGAPKAGLSPELDALAAYVSSLAGHPPSPYRAADGTLTESARRGREIFITSGCAACHLGSAFADGMRHDVGTIAPSSGLGIGAPLAGAGFDTPTLRSIWSTAPYFHDGSAATLEQVLERHGDLPPLGDEARGDLIDYLLQLDGTSLPPEASCDLGPDECAGGGGPAPADAGLPAADAGVPSPIDRPDAGGEPVNPVAPVDGEGCGCSTGAGTDRPVAWMLLALGLSLRLRRRSRRAA